MFAQDVIFQSDGTISDSQTDGGRHVLNLLLPRPRISARDFHHVHVILGIFQPAAGAQGRRKLGEIHGAHTRAATLGA